MSFLLIRPPIPEPLMPDNSASLIRCSSIKARTAGDSRVRPSALSAAAGARAGTSAPLAATTGFDGCDAGALGVAARVAAVDSSITAISVPTVTVVPSFTLISFSTPASGAGTSAFTLSVITSTSPSYFLTWSPGCLSHFEIVPSVIDSPSCGILTDAISAPLVGGQLPGLDEDLVDAGHEGVLEDMVEGHGRDIGAGHPHHRGVERVEGVLHDD